VQARPPHSGLIAQKRVFSFRGKDSF